MGGPPRGGGGRLGAVLTLWGYDLVERRISDDPEQSRCHRMSAAEAGRHAPAERNV